MKKILLALMFVLLISDFGFSGEKKENLKKTKKVDAEIQNIEIKGIRIGMTQEELEALVGRRLPEDNFNGTAYIGRDFSIAGVFSNDYEVFCKFYENKLDLFVYEFSPDNFSALHEAINKKFPSIKCEESVVTNAMGASFNQVSCVLRDKKSSLLLSKFPRDIRTSTLMLISKRLSYEMDAEKEKKKNDL